MSRRPSYDEGDQPDRRRVQAARPRFGEEPPEERVSRRPSYEEADQADRPRPPAAHPRFEDELPEERVLRIAPTERTPSELAGIPRIRVAEVPREEYEVGRPLTEVSAPEPSIQERRVSPGERDYADARGVAPSERAESPRVPLGRDFTQQPGYAGHPDVIRVRSGGQRSPSIIRITSPGRFPPSAPPGPPAPPAAVTAPGIPPPSPSIHVHHAVPRADVEHVEREPDVVRILRSRPPGPPGQPGPPEPLYPSAAAAGQEFHPSAREARPTAQGVRPPTPEVPSTLEAPSTPGVRFSAPGVHPSSPEIRPSAPEVRPSATEVRRLAPSAPPSVPDAPPPSPPIPVRQAVPHEGVAREPEVIRIRSVRPPGLSGPPEPPGPPQPPAAVAAPGLPPTSPSIHVHQAIPHEHEEREPEVIRIRSSGRESPTVIRVASPVSSRIGPSHVHIHHDGARHRGVTFQPPSDSGRRHEGHYENEPPIRIHTPKPEPESEESPHEYSPSTLTSGPQFAEESTQRSPSPRSDFERRLRESQRTEPGLPTISTQRSPSLRPHLDRLRDSQRTEPAAPTIVPTIGSRSPSPRETVRTGASEESGEPPIGQPLEYETAPTGPPVSALERPPTSVPPRTPLGVPIEPRPLSLEEDEFTESRTPSGSEESPPGPRILSDAARSHLDTLDQERRDLFDRAEAQREEVSRAAEARRTAAALEFDEAEQRRQQEFEQREAARQRLFEEAETTRAAEHEARRQTLSEQAEQRRESLAAAAAAERSAAEESLRESLTRSVQVSQDLASAAASERQSVADLASLVQSYVDDKAEAEREARRLSSEVLAEREEVVDQQTARIRELEDELRRCREECEAERAQRRELEERQGEDARAEGEARHNEIWTRLGDIQNSLQDRVDADTRRQELEEERLAAKDARRNEKHERMASLHELVNAIINDREEEKQRAAEEREAAAAKPCTQFWSACYTSIVSHSALHSDRGRHR